MHPGQHVKVVSALKPSSVATSATAHSNVDTLGFDYAQFEIHLNSATAAPTVMKLTEGDTTTSYSDVTGFVGGTSFTIPAFDSANAQIVLMNVELKGRKRHLQLGITPAAAHIMSAICRLSRGEITPITDAEHGAAEIVTG